MNIFRKVSPVVITGVVLTFICLGLYISGSTFIQAVSNYAYNSLMKGVHSPPKSGRVVIVDIDDESLGRPEIGQWPWPRYLVAEMTKNILGSGASVVAFDVVFSEKDRTSPSVIRANLNRYFNLNVELSGVPENLWDYDLLFADVLKRGKTILGCAMVLSDEPLDVIDKSIDPSFRQNYWLKGKNKHLLDKYLLPAKGLTLSIRPLTEASRSAFFNATADNDNIVRSNPLVWMYGSTKNFESRIYPALALEALRLDMGLEKCIIEYDDYGVTQIKLKDILIPVDKCGRLIVNFRTINKSPRTGFNSSFPVYPAWEVLSGKVSRSELSNKIVFVGTSAVGLNDRRAIPLTQDFSGVEVHATIVDNILAGDMLYMPNWMEGVHCIAIVLMGLFLTFFISRGISWLSFLMSLLMIAVMLVMSLILFGRYHIVFVPVWVILSIIIIYPTLTMIKFWQEELQKKRVRDMFGTMVSENVLHFLENNPGSFSLSGQKKEATMFFSDIAGFTTISENLPPEKLSEFLNRYLSPMTHIIMDRNGYVDKYEGDLIMAEWGVPYSMQDHARQACLAAIEQQEKLAELRPVLKKEFGHEIFVRMGINSGSVTAGNMGSDRRFQYTVMGDAVNQAARLEPANKEYGTLIIIGETTYGEAAEAIEARLLDKMVVKGKKKPIGIYELIGRKGCLSPEKLKVVELYQEALRLHWERRWDEAINLLQSALELDPGDTPGAKLLERIQKYKYSPPPEGWTGEYMQTRKD